MQNRAVLIVRPKQPYVDWAAQLDDSGVVPDSEGDETVYLIPEFESDTEAWEILEGLYAEVFARELECWCTDESAWPKNRSFAMFEEWFDIEYHSIVEDLCAYAIEDDDNYRVMQSKACPLTYTCIRLARFAADHGCYRKRIAYDHDY